MAHQALWQHLQFAKQEASDAAAEVGTVLTLGWHSYSRTPINSAPAQEFRTQYGYCKTAKRALVRVLQSYRAQLLSGENCMHSLFI